MRRIAKVLGIVLGVVIVFFVALVLIVGMLFDPNDYKDQITAAVSDATGRTLTLDGDLELELFPRLRIAVGAASLSNAAGFGDEPFAALDGARLQLGLLSLLSGRVEVDEARLLGLRLNLARDARGGNNWQDLAGGGSAAAPADAAASGDGGGSSLDLGIGAIEIADAEVTWRDAATGTDWLLTDFNLEASDFGPGRAFPLSMEFGFTGSEIDVRVESSMRATLALDDNRYRLDDLDVAIEGEGAAWPGGSGEASLSFATFAADLDAQTLELVDLTLEMLGLEVSGTLNGASLFDDLTLTGAIDIAEFNPNDVLEVFGTEIETADSDVFRRARARADFSYDARQMGLRNMELRLDDSTLTGSAGLRGEALNFDLAVDSINIDRYLPPGEDAPSDDEGSIDEVDLPLEPLRNFVANGRLSLAEAKFLNMTFTDANFALMAGNGRMMLTPTGTLYGGSIAGEISVALQGEGARLGLRQTLTGVDLFGFARDFLDTEALSGTGNVNIDVAATGSNVGAIRRDLDGTASFSLVDGAWEGIDAWYELRRARAVTNGDPAPEREGPRRTTFSRVSATGVVENAVLTTNDFNATLPFMALNGRGTVNLLTEEIDFTATAGLTDGPVLQSDPAMAELAGSELPLTVTGTLAAPSIRPDFGAIVRARVRSEVQQRVEEEQEEAREEVRDRLRDRLRGVLDR